MATRLVQPREYTPEQRLKALEFVQLNPGMSIRKQASMIGVPQETLRDWIFGAGVLSHRRFKNTRGKHLKMAALLEFTTEKLVKAIVSMLNDEGRFKAGHMPNPKDLAILIGILVDKAVTLRKLAEMADVRDGFEKEDTNDEHDLGIEELAGRIARGQAAGDPPTSLPPADDQGEPADPPGDGLSQAE
jgi:hypothetical protein